MPTWKSRAIAGSATLTTLLSRNTAPDPSTEPATTQRPAAECSRSALRPWPAIRLRRREPIPSRSSGVRIVRRRACGEVHSACPFGTAALRMPTLVPPSTECSAVAPYASSSRAARRTGARARRTHSPPRSAREDPHHHRAASRDAASRSAPTRSRDTARLARLHLIERLEDPRRDAPGMPMPVSLTEYIMSAPSTRTASVTVPVLVNLIAFESRLRRIWRSLVTSVSAIARARTGCRHQRQPLDRGHRLRQRGRLARDANASPRLDAKLPRAAPRVASTRESHRSAKADAARRSGCA